MDVTDHHASEALERERGRLFAIAYGMLGSSADGEDVVQEAFLRWHEEDRSAVRQPAAFLTTIVRRLAIDRLRPAERRRVEYVGPWLPEPLVSDLDAVDLVSEAEELSLALLAALERLNPVERAVLLLRDVFDFDYSEIAEIVEKGEANCRQIARRARARVGERRRRFRPTDQRSASYCAPSSRPPGAAISRRLPACSPATRFSGPTAAGRCLLRVNRSTGPTGSPASSSRSRARSRLDCASGPFT
jgi:RNA polymerase sigma factor (sigma-70 family)